MNTSTSANNAQTNADEIIFQRIPINFNEPPIEID